MLKDKKLAFDWGSAVVKSGYGGACHNFTLALLRLGVNLTGLDKRIKPDIQLAMTQPDRRWQNEWQRRADIFGIFTMFETSILPEHWVEDMNKHFDFVIVPSAWCAEVFEGQGVTKPIHIVPLGIEPQIFPYLQRPQHDKFNILWQGFHYEDRKGFQLLQRAFDELKLPNTRLIDKISPYSLQSPSNWEFRAERWSICRNMNQAELLLLLREADISINPTSGEGFGLIPLEHMATGLPVIVSHNSGCLEYRNDKYNIGIDCVLGKNWYGEKFGDVMLPDYDDLKAKMLWAYEHQTEIIEIGKRASEWVHRNWTYDQATYKLIKVLQNYI